MRILGLLVVVLVLVAGGWTGLWFYAAGEAGRGLDRWIADEATQGRRWVCPDRAILGYPVALEIACANPSFAGLSFGQQAVGAADGVRIKVGLTDPHHALVVLTPPLTYRTADKQVDFVARWSAMSVDLGGLPSQVTGGTLRAADAHAQGRFGTGKPVIAEARALALTLTGVAGQPDPTLDFAIGLDGAAAPLLDQILGDVQPVDAAVQGRLTQAIFEDTDTPATLMERWRQRGGAITVSSAHLVRQSVSVEASGTLQLDGAHRIEGKLDAGFSGAEPILRRYGINPNLVAAGSILNSLFGKHNPPAGSSRGSIQLPIQFRNGKLAIGPVVTPIGLPPLY